MCCFTAICFLCVYVFCICERRCFIFCFFKQKTAYEMRISDWSSDVCSSDLSDGDSEKRAIGVDAGDEIPRRALWPENGVRRESQARLWRARPFARHPHGQCRRVSQGVDRCTGLCAPLGQMGTGRSEEHTSELQSLMRISYAVFCLKKKTKDYQHQKQQ